MHKPALSQKRTVSFLNTISTWCWQGCTHSQAHLFVTLIFPCSDLKITIQCGKMDSWLDPKSRQNSRGGWRFPSTARLSSRFITVWDNHLMSVSVVAGLTCSQIVTRDPLFQWHILARAKQPAAQGGIFWGGFLTLRKPAAPWSTSF